LWRAQLASIPDDHDMFNVNSTVGKHSYRLVKHETDAPNKSGQRACWENLLVNMYNALSSKVYHPNHCVTHTGQIQHRGGRNRKNKGGESYIHVAFGKNLPGVKGIAKSKHRNFHTVVYLLFHPECLDLLESKVGLGISHYCHRPRCGNVWDHLSLVPGDYNTSQNDCRNGSAGTCPHRPKRCVFVDTTGRPLPCLNNPLAVPATCTCVPNCLQSRDLPYSTPGTGIIQLWGFKDEDDFEANDDFEDNDDDNDFEDEDVDEDEFTGEFGGEPEDNSEDEDEDEDEFMHPEDVVIEIEVSK
jgi:hypothetical protein